MGRKRKPVKKRPPSKIVAIAPKISETSVTSPTQQKPNDSAKSSENNSFLLTPEDTTIYMNKQASPKSTETQSLLYPCNECEFLFASNDSLSSHIRMMHPIISKSAKNINSKSMAFKGNPTADTVVSKRVIKLSNKGIASIQGDRAFKIGKQAEERTDDTSGNRTFEIGKQAEEGTNDASENPAKGDRRLVTLKCGTTITVTVNDKEVVKPIESTPKLSSNPFKYGNPSKKIKIIKDIDTAKAVEITPIITSSRSLCTEKGTRKSRQLKNIRKVDSPKLRSILPKPIINEPDKGDFDLIFDQNIKEESIDPLSNVKVEIKDETIEVEDIFNQDINAGYENEPEPPIETASSSSSYSQLLGDQAPNVNTLNLPEILEASPEIRHHLKYLSLIKKQPKILPRLSTGGRSLFYLCLLIYKKIFYCKHCQ